MAAAHPVSVVVAEVISAEAAVSEEEVEAGGGWVVLAAAAGWTRWTGRRPAMHRRGQTAGAVFGNRRRRNQQIHGMASFTLQNSELNAKPFSLNGLDVPQAAYAQSRFSLFIGGPLVIPENRKGSEDAILFLSYFGTRSKSPKLFTETVPSLNARNGDLSQATQSLGTSATNVPISCSIRQLICHLPET